MRTQHRLFATIIAFVVLAFTCGSISSVYAQSGRVTLKPTADTYVDSNNPSSNYGGRHTSTSDIQSLALNLTKPFTTT